MRSLFDNVPLVVILFVVVSVVRAIAGAVSKKPDETAEGGGDSEDQRRVREIQERIRRLAAERSGQKQFEVPPPAGHRPEPPPVTLFEPKPIRPIDTFGGPVRRSFEDVDRRLHTPKERPEPVPSVAAEVERQEALREQIRALEEKRYLTERHAKQVAQEKSESSASEGGQLTAARSKLIDDLKDPASLRRNMILREVLGPPLALR